MKNILDYYNEEGLLVLDQTLEKKGDTDLITDGDCKAQYKQLTKLQEIIKDKLLLFNKSSQCYGVTLTFKTKFHSDDPRWLHVYVINLLNRSYLWQHKKYILYPEFTKKGILHYHGCIKDIYQCEFIKLCLWWSRTFGYVKPELTINNFHNWSTYITKDLGKTGLWTINSNV